MGITSSKEEPNEMASLASQIDDIAVNYILNQNTIDLLRLTDKEYYDNLIILTSSIIDKKLNKLELGFLNNRVFGKKTITDMIDVIPASNKIKEKVVFNISKFYIKIIMVYSAIATTIDPQYSYEGSDGNKKTFYLKDMQEYKNIPKNVKPILVQLTNPMNLCRKRLDILKNKLDLNVDDSFIKINPGEKLCSLKATSLLTDEVGIKELDSLYYDIFDYETKTWNKRSKKMKQKYNKDLILFYQIFTGKQIKPANIQSFHDIELLDMSTLDSCKDVKFMQDILVKKNDSLIQDYIQKINMIENTTQKYRTKLFEILKELFVIKLNDNENKYTLNPELTMDHIILLETETRDTILNLYTSCEKYFIQALIIFEKIYNEQVKTLNVERVNYIEQIKTPPPEVLETTPEPVIGVSGELMFGVSGEPIIGVSGEPIVGVSGEPIVGVSGEPIVGVSGEQSSIFGITLPSFMASSPPKEENPLETTVPEPITQSPEQPTNPLLQQMAQSPEQPTNPLLQQMAQSPEQPTVFNPLVQEMTQSPQPMTQSPRQTTVFSPLVQEMAQSPQQTTVFSPLVQQMTQPTETVVQPFTQPMTQPTNPLMQPSETVVQPMTQPTNPFIQSPQTFTQPMTQPTNPLVQQPMLSPQVETFASQTLVPQTSTVPQTTLTQPSAPQMLAPQTTLTQTSVPQTSAPQTTLAQPSVPQTMAPIQSSTQQVQPIMKGGNLSKVPLQQVFGS